MSHPDRDPTQRQIRLLKCIRPASQMNPDERSAADIAERWNAQKDLRDMFGTVTTNAAYNRMRKLELRGWVSRETWSRPILWSLTRAGIRIVNNNTLSPTEYIE